MSARRFMRVSTATKILADIWRETMDSPVSPEVSKFMKRSAHALFIQFGPEPNEDDERQAKVEIVQILVDGGATDGGSTQAP